MNVFESNISQRVTWSFFLHYLKLFRTCIVLKKSFMCSFCLNIWMDLWENLWGLLQKYKIVNYRLQPYFEIWYKLLAFHLLQLPQYPRNPKLVPLFHECCRNQLAPSLNFAFMARIEVLIFFLMSGKILVQDLNSGNNVHKVHFGTGNSMDICWLQCLAAWEYRCFVGEFTHNSCARVGRWTKTWFTLNFLSTEHNTIKYCVSVTNVSLFFWYSRMKDPL